MIDKIYNEDCLEGMKRIPDGAVDFILTDLPFGITDCEFDVRIPFDPMWEQFKRVTKGNAAIALFSQMPFGSDLIQSNRKMFRYEWIWQKTVRNGFLNAHKMPLKSHENILIFYRKLPTYNPQKWKSTPYSRKFSTKSINYSKGGWKEGYVTESPNGDRMPIDVIKFNSDRVLWGKGRMYHPTQKPTDLLEYLIKMYSNEGELVLDATIGSGSTAVACIRTNRHFIGFETEERFYDIANERITKAQAEKQQALF